MNEQIKHAFEEYRKAVQAEAALTEEIQGREDKRPTPEDQTQFERMEADIDLWRKETQRLLKVAERSKEVDEVRSQFATLFQQDDKREREPAKSDDQKLVELARRNRETGELGSFDSTYTPGVMEALSQRWNTRALATPGGTAFGSTFIDRLHWYEVDESPMLDPAIVQILETQSGNKIYWPRLTANPNVAGTLTAEEAGLTAADATLSNIELDAYKYGGITVWSSELDEDNVIGLRDVLARSLARDVAEKVNSPLTIGNGSNVPHGIVTAAANGGTALGTAQVGGESFFGWPDVVNLQFAVKPSYRRRGQYMVGTAAFAKIRKFRDANGSPIFQPPLAPGQPDTFNGFPIHENPDMVAAASATRSVLFGDTQLYIVRRVGTTRVLLSEHYKFETDQLAVRVTERIDGELLDGQAVAALISAAT